MRAPVGALMMTFLDRLRQRRVMVAALVFQDLPAVRAYWEALRHKAALPRRDMLDPRGLAGGLERIFRADPVGRGIVRIRIAGSALATLADTDLQGLPLSCLFAAESRPALALVLDRVLTGPAVAELDLGQDRGATGRPVARLLLLPLAEDAERRSLMGVLGWASGHAPRGRLQILSRQEERLSLPQTDPPIPQAGSRVGRHLTLVRQAT